MITDAIAAKLRTVTGLDVYVNQAPLDSIPCIVIDDNGDSRDKYFSNTGAVATGLIDRDYEFTIWADLENGGSRYVAQVAETITAALDNFTGQLQTATSPNLTHRVAFIETNDGGADFNEAAQVYGHSVFAVVTYA